MKKTKCACGHKLHEKTCQEPVNVKGVGWIACGCFRVNGKDDWWRL